MRRFSLRTLLIAVALLGVVLGLIGREIQQRRVEAKLHELCIQLGAQVTYTGEEGGKVIELGFTQAVDLDDEHLKQFARFSRLRTLWLNYSDPDLTSKVTGRGLEALAKYPELRELHIDRGLLNDGGFRHLKQLTRLESLTIWGLRYDDPRGEELRLALPQCKIGW